jgi:hypothetical protein
LLHIEQNEFVQAKEVLDAMNDLDDAEQLLLQRCTQQIDVLKSGR